MCARVRVFGRNVKVSDDSISLKLLLITNKKFDAPQYPPNGCHVNDGKWYRSRAAAAAARSECTFDKSANRKGKWNLLLHGTGRLISVRFMAADWAGERASGRAG